MSSQGYSAIERHPTGIEGFDHVAGGGLPRGRVTLVAGTSGSAKTVFGTQFLARGLEMADEPGVFVTTEETTDDIRRNMISLGWDIAGWEAQNKWAFVDVTPTLNEETVEAGPYDLGALLARIEHAVRRIGAKRLVFDSLGAFFAQFLDHTLVRKELFRIASVLRQLGVTSLISVERTQEYGDIARYGVEEFVVDNVILLRNVLEGEKRRRTLEILKFRGTFHRKGEYPFTIMPGQGITVLPLSEIALEQRSSDMRITSGLPELDSMCGGGFFRDAILLVSGATGCGKTLLTTQFLSGGAREGERCLLFAFEESREQLFRNARGWGVDYEKMEQEGLLRVVCEYPEVAGLEDHLLHMKEVIKDYKPDRLAVDSLSALERVSTVRSYREFVIGMTSYIKQNQIAGLFTATTPTLMGGASATETHISTLTDAIILLRYVEMFGEMRRGLTVLKMRGSMHDKSIREFTIDMQGAHIGRPFRNVIGILEGHPRHVETTEITRIGGLFQDGA